MRTKNRLALAISAITVAMFLVALFAWPSRGVQALLATLSPPAKPSYLLGETVTFEGSVQFSGTEHPDNATVTIYIDGPQPVTQQVPTVSGVYDYPANRLKVRVERDLIDQGYWLEHGYLLSPVWVRYYVEWAAPMFLSPPPVFKVIPDYEFAFAIPAPAPTPTPTPGGPAELPSTTLAFSVPILPTPTPEPGAAPDLPGFDAGFNVPLLPTPTPPPGVVDLPSTTEVFAVPLPPTPTPDPLAPSDLPSADFAWDIPLPPTPTPVPGVPVLGEPVPTAVVFPVPDDLVPEGIAYNGTDFYILVNGPTEWDNDAVLVVDSSGALVRAFGIPTFRAQGITYLNDHLYIADNQMWPPKILKVNPADGTTVSSFDSPEGVNIRGLANDGTRLWMASEWGDRFFKVTTGGTLLDTVWTGGWGNFNAMAMKGTNAFLAQGDRIGAWSIETKQSIQSWYTTVTAVDIRGMVFVGEVLYLADADTRSVHKTQSPYLETITTEAVGMAYDGTNLYIAVNGSPKDKILVVNPATGALVNSYSAPDHRVGGLAYLGTSLYALSNVERKVKKLNPANGSVISDWFGPGWDELTGVASNGTNLFIGQRTGRDLFVRSATGTDLGNIGDWGSPMDGYQALAYRSLVDEFYSALADKIGRFGGDGKYRQSWTISTPAAIETKAMEFVGEVLYLADLTTGKMYKASIPSGIEVTQDPLDLTNDGTDLYVLVDARPKDKVLKVNKDTGEILASIDAPSDRCDGITHLGGYLYVADNATSPRYIRKLNPSTGAQVDSFAPGSGWDDIASLHTDGTDLLVGFAMMNKITKVRASDGFELATYWADWMDPRTKSTGLAWRASTQEILAADGGIKKIVRLDNQGHYRQAWTMTLTDITGLTFIGDILYIADNGTDKVYKASIPTGLQITNEPQDLVYDQGTNTLFVLVDALPVDKVLKVDPTTGLLKGTGTAGSIDAPSEKVDAITFLGGSLYVADNAGTRNIRELNPANGNELNSFPSPCCNDITALTDDGVDLIAGRRDSKELYRLRASDGFQLATLWGDWMDPRMQTGGLAFHTFDTQDFFFAVDPSIRKIVRLDSEGHYIQLWTLTLTKMRGLTFVGNTLYIADAETKKVYRASIPTGIQVTKVPQGLAYDQGTNTLFVLVDALPVDKILKVDPATGLLKGTGTAGSIDAPSNKVDGITFLGGSLYVADNADVGGQRYIRKLNPSDGAEVDSFLPPDPWQDITGLTNDGEYLVVGRRDDARLGRLDPANGSLVGSWVWPDMGDPRTNTDALAYQASADKFMAADGKKLVRLDEQLHFRQTWTTTVLDIRGLTFVGDTLFIADANTESVYFSLIPPPVVTTTTVPTDMTSDGIYLYVLTDGSPVDTVLVIEPSDGSLVRSFNAPGDNAEAITYISGYLYIATNEWDGWAFKGESHKVHPATGEETIGGGYPAPNPKGIEIGSLAPGTALGLANKLIAGPKYGGSIFIIDLDNPTVFQERSVNPGGFPIWLEGFQAMAAGSLYAVSGPNFLQIKWIAGEPKVVELRGLPAGVKITGMAFVGTTLYLADAEGSRVLASTAPGKRPEITIAGAYQAWVGATMPGQAEVTSGLIDFTLEKITEVQVQILQPTEGEAFSTPSVQVVSQVNDPSINTLFLGLDLPFSKVVNDMVEDPVISDRWSKTGLWKRVSAPPGKAASPAYAYYYGQVPPQPMNYDTGAPNSGALTSWEFASGEGATLEFDTWYDTEPGFHADLKQIQVYGTLGTETKWWNVAQIVDFVPMPAPPPPLDAAPFFVYIPVPMAHFEFIGAQPKPVFDRVFLDLSPFAGQTIRIRFYFDTIDGKINEREGWYIDNIVVTSATSLTQAVPRGADDLFTATINLAEGPNTIFVKAINPYTEPPLTDSDEVHVSLDSTLPILSIVPVTSPTNTPSQAITVHFQEPNWDLFTLEISNALGSRIVASIKERPIGDFLTQTVALAVGNNVITASLTDKAGWSSSASAAILVDMQAPTVTTLPTLYPMGVVSGRPGRGTQEGDRVIFQVDASDDAAGVAGIYAIFPAAPGEPPELVRFLWAGAGAPPAGFEAIPQAVRDQWGATADFILPMDVPAGTPPGTYNIEVLAMDYANNRAFATVGANVEPTLRAFTTYLMPNWNLAGLPLIPDETLYAPDQSKTQIQKLVGGISGLERILYYDAATATWHISRSDGSGDLAEMGTGKGYWFYMNPSVFGMSPPLRPGLPNTPIPIKFSYEGVVLKPAEVPPTYNLVARWNLISLHAEWPKTAETYLKGVRDEWAYLIQYNNYIRFEKDQPPDIQLGGFQSLGATDYMLPGLGFWLFLREPGSIAALP